MTWIIEFIGDLSESADLNMDGSTSLRAVCLASGDDLPAALTNLVKYAMSSGITPTSFLKIEDLSTFTTTAEDGYTSREINTGLKRLNSESLVVFTYAISSEAESDDEAIEIGTGR